MGMTHTSESIPWFKGGESFVSSSHQRLHRQKHGESSQNHQQRMGEHHFRDQWQVRPLIWNTPANSKRGLECVADLHEVCVSVPHWWAEAVQCLATKNMAVVPHTPYLPCDLLSFPWMKSKLQGHWVQLPLKFRNNCCLTCDSKMSVPAVLLAVAKKLDSLHKLGQRPITKVTIYSSINSDQELLDMPSYAKYSVVRHLVTISQQSITMYDTCLSVYLMTFSQLCMFMIANDCKW